MGQRVGSVLVLVVACCLPPGPAGADTLGPDLRPGQSVQGGDRLVSASGQRTLDLERSVGEDPGLFVDTIGLDLSSEGCGPTYVDSTVDIESRHSTLRMQEDGNLVWYRGPYPVMDSGTAGNPGAYARMQDDGNFVLYSPAGNPLWRLDNPCTFLPDTVFVDGRPRPATLKPGWFLQDVDRRHRLRLQDDGNLVLTGPGGRPLWHTRTHGNPGASLILQGDGNLVLYSAGGRALWSSGTGGGAAGAVSYLTVESNGDVVLYRQGEPVWSTGTAGRA